MSNVITAQFRVTKRFEFDNQVGYLILKCDDEKMPYFLAFEKDLGSRKVDEQFDVELPLRHGRVLPASWMVNVWPTEKSRQSPEAPDALKRLYLSYLYQVALRANTPRNSVQRKYDKESVFATPECRIIEELYRILTKKKLRDELAMSNFLYTRRPVYTRFEENGNEMNYKTPRHLKYYPDDQIVVATFFLNDHPATITSESGKEYSDFILGSHVRGVVTRTTKGEGWITLREYMMNDPKIDAYVRSFVAQGFGTLEGREDWGLPPLK